MRATDEICTAVNRIVWNPSDAESQVHSRRKERRIPLHCGITITPLREPGASPQECSEGSFTGYVRDISPNGVGLIHDRPLEKASVILAFELENDECIQFIADVLWCEKQQDGQYISGGKFKRLARWTARD
jgi:hypothetical protein